MSTKQQAEWEWAIMQNTLRYGGGWEVVSCEPTRQDALRAAREYRENQPELPVKIKRLRASN